MTLLEAMAALFILSTAFGACGLAWLHSLSELHNGEERQVLTTCLSTAGERLSAGLAVPATLSVNGMTCRVELQEEQDAGATWEVVTASTPTQQEKLWYRTDDAS